MRTAPLFSPAGGCFLGSTCLADVDKAERERSLPSLANMPTSYLHTKRTCALITWVHVEKHTCVWMTHTWLVRVWGGLCFLWSIYKKKVGGWGGLRSKRALVGVTLVSWSSKTAGLPDLLWLTHTPRSDSLTARDYDCSRETGKTSLTPHSTIAHLQLWLILGEGKVGRGSGSCVAGDSPKNFLQVRS